MAAMSLRTRLLLSYALVILVCVAMMGVALLFLLRDAPVQKRLITPRLTLEAATVNRLLRTPLQNGVPPEQIIRRLQNIGDRTDSRILLIDEPSGQILADTENRLTHEKLFHLGAPQRFNSTLIGEFDEGGTRWLYSTRPAAERRATPEVVAALPYEAVPAFSDPIFRALLQPLLIALVLAFLSRSYALPDFQALDEISAGEPILRDTADAQPAYADIVSAEPVPTTTAAPEPTPAAPTQASGAADSGNDATPLAIGAILILLAIAGGIVAVVILTRRNNPNTKGA